MYFMISIEKSQNVGLEKRVPKGGLCNNPELCPYLIYSTLPLSSLEWGCRWDSIGIRKLEECVRGVRKHPDCIRLDVIKD